MAGNLLQTLYNLVDAFFLGKLGKAALSAPSISFPIVFFLVVFAFGFSMAGTTLISQSKGKNDREKIDFYLGQTTTVMVIVGVLVSILGFVLTPSLLKLLSVPEDAYLFTRQYMRIIFTGLPFMFMAFILQAALHGIGDSITPLIVLGSTVLLNIALDPICIFGFAFVPAMGVRGAAIATVVSRFVGSFVACIILIRGRRGVQLRIGAMRLQGPALRLLLKIGVPASISQGVSALGFTVLQGIVNSFGTSVIAAFGIGNRIISLFNMPAMGFSRATAVVVGQRLGAKDKSHAWLALKQSAISILVFITAGMLFMFFRGSTLVRIFIDDPDVLTYGKELFRIVSISVIFFTLFTVLMGALQGAGETRPGMYLNIARVWVFRAPIAYLLGNEVGPQGIWWSMFISNFVVAIVGIFIVMRGRWMDRLDPDAI
jgi:putative MATE family efflux protein